ncbi:unnamed protein product [Darwinula stevensoni]|uniref:Fibronectin type-III domain-containing protein n=1 Tax=Darwinula stevensoni TaxID=69355 RepID=A0A7R8XC82_9CRUS|nr:unnamed protein product [Darwinula stevensoni]CAG0888573.1 unnamed protein product [Darwinula stevensoni]
MQPKFSDPFISRPSGNGNGGRWLSMHAERPRSKGRMKMNECLWDLLAPINRLMDLVRDVRSWEEKDQVRDVTSERGTENSSPVREDWRGSGNEEDHEGGRESGAGANENEKEEKDGDPEKVVTLVVIPPSNIEVMWVCSPTEGVRYEVVYHPVGSTYKIVLDVEGKCGAVLEQLMPYTRYQLHVVTYTGDTKLSTSSIVFFETEAVARNRFGRPVKIQDYTSGNTVRGEEIGIVLLVLFVWVGAVSLFFHRWGKIRMLEPYQPSYQEHMHNCSIAAAQIYPRGSIPNDFVNLKPLAEKFGFLGGTGGSLGTGTNMAGTNAAFNLHFGSYSPVRYRDRVNSVFVCPPHSLLSPGLSLPPRRAKSAEDIKFLPAIPDPHRFRRSSELTQFVPHKTSKRPKIPLAMFRYRQMQSIPETDCGASGGAGSSKNCSADVSFELEPFNCSSEGTTSYNSSFASNAGSCAEIRIINTDV